MRGNSDEAKRAELNDLTREMAKMERDALSGFPDMDIEDVKRIKAKYNEIKKKCSKLKKSLGLGD